MPYKKVEKNSRVGRGEASEMISIRASKTIGINKPALEDFFGDHTHAVLYYDPENNKLALKPDKGEDDSGYKISRSNSGGSLGCSAFLKQHDLVDEEQTRQYKPELESINGDTEAPVIHLDDPVDTTTRSSPDEEDSSEDSSEE